ncbi:MAG: tRNA (cytidine(56)-2'-O)-methyltransferase [Methanosarcinales archaeon]|nr:MAG: tRNA (cytidine(56)-2'-O)-methyltransferase [Methanosarcinales archaeon]
MKRIVVLRLGHRLFRDQRMTTHVALTARALGAEGVLFISGDKTVEQSLRDARKRWGGEFYVRGGVNWRDEIRKWKDAGGKVCHLTMYGINLPDVIDEIKGTKNLMVIVGAEKVPAEVYDLVDWNVAIGQQPHSEVAALAIFLDRLQEGEELKRSFKRGLKIIPKRKGKCVKRG